MAFERLLGISTEAIQALDYRHYFSDTSNPGTVVIGISSSDATGVVLAALEEAQKRGAYTIGMSNTAGSALLGNFDNGILVHATRVGWGTQASTATMALMIQFAVTLARKTGNASPGLIESIQTGLNDLPIKLIH